MNNSILRVIVLLLFAGKLIAGEPAMIWVEFTDKANSPFSLSQPHEFLSPRAIERRQNQSIPIDFYDIPVSPHYVNTIVTETGMELYYTSRWFNGAMFKAQSADVAEMLAQFDFVSFNEIAKSKVPDKSEESGTQQTNVTARYQHLNDYKGGFPFSDNIYPEMIADYGSAEGQVTLVNGQSLHNRGYWGAGKVIAVLDAGFRAVDTLRAFKEMWAHNQILGYYDFSQARQELYQGHSHGSLVFSVMAASIPGEYSGVATAASYWLLRTEDAASEFRVEEYNWLAGAEYADSVGADIINSSLGYTVFDDPSQNYTYNDLDGGTTVVARAANMAFSRGILVVNSAGNYGTQNWRYIGSPADAHGALAVGGTNSEGNRASFSSVGPTPDGRVKPQVMAQAQAVSVVNTMGGIGNANGTSFSAPLIAGMAACLWEMFPEASNKKIQQAIVRSGDRYLMPDSLYGYGIPDFELAISFLEKKLEDAKYLKLANNPLLPESAISFYAYQHEVISIELINSSGQKVWNKGNITVYPGYNEIKPFSDIAVLSSGMYLIRVNFGHRAELLKAIKF